MGIGGIGMSGIAELLMNLRFNISISIFPHLSPGGLDTEAGRRK